MGRKLDPKIIEHYKKIGVKGGKARAKKLSHARRIEIGKLGAKTRWRRQ